MVAISNYITTELIGDGNNSLVYRGFRESDKKRVIIKLLKEERPSLKQLARFEYEYQLLDSLQGDGAVAVYDLIKYQDVLAMIQEDFGTQSLKELLSEKKLSLLEFLKLALRITEGIEKIHQHHIIHKDINPTNILWDAKTQQIKIIDFGIASLLPRELSVIRDRELLAEGMLNYMSPEQTGRMNRGIDYRTDYYSLGITFYQILTGTLPFKSDDMGELVYQHIAKQPIYPHEIDETIPITVSKIIIKLLEKSPEDRYQSTYGLKADLQNCLDQLKLKGRIENFSVGQKDVAAQFQISEKLYGREQELNSFIYEFQQANQGHARLVLVTGYAGVGKSTLVHEIYKPLVEKRGYFISGKFDQFKRNVPFSSLIQTIQELIQQILMESETEISNWRKRIQNAVGPNGQVVTNMIPMLTEIIGVQPPIEELGPTETQNRFNFVFESLIQALASKEHPLVIFLDDCQWADIYTLNLIKKLLLHPESNYFLIIAAYRDNETNKQHILNVSLNALQKAGFTYQNISLKPLKIEHISELLFDTLHQQKKLIQPLAKICHEKTEGNPFFLNQFLQTLYKNGLIEFDFNKGVWHWDLKRIEEQIISRNVAEFLVSKIQKLSARTQEVVKYAACLGSSFDLQSLVKISGIPPKKIANDLLEAIKEGLIHPTNQNYKFVVDDDNEDVSYQFLHDRVRQAAHSLIPAESRNLLHLKIGRLLLANSSEEKIQESLLDILSHINCGANLITDNTEKLSIAKLNLTAGKKAIASIAYSEALNYLQRGMMLSNHDWINQYNLSLELYTAATEAAYLDAQFDQMKKYCKTVLENATHLLDKVKVYEFQLLFLTSQNQMMEAIKLGGTILKLFGIKLPTKPTIFHSIMGLLKLKILIFGKTPDDLYNLPEMVDPYPQAILRLLIILLNPLFLTYPKLVPWFAYEIIKLSIKYGNAPQSATGYLLYGAVLVQMNKLDAGFEFGELSLRILEKFHAESMKPNIALPVNTFILQFRQPIVPCINETISHFQTSLQTGNLFMASVAAFHYCAGSFYVGKELNQLIKETKSYASFQKRSGNEVFYELSQIYLQAELNLLGLSRDRTLLTGDAFNEKKFLETNSTKKTISFEAYYFVKLILCYLFGEYKLSYEYGNKLINIYADKSIGVYANYIFYFYYSLACLGFYPEAEKKQQKQLLNIIKTNQKKLRHFSKVSPMNYLNKCSLIEAELARIIGNDEKAAVLYDQAINFAKQNDLINEEAIANELTAKFYLNQGKEKIARVYMQDAHYAYTKWGAAEKTKDLEKKYPQLLKEKISRSNTGLTFYSNKKHSMDVIIDLSTIMKAAQAISSEMVLSDLLKKMMSIVIENAGAQRGFFLLEKEGQWVIEAASTIEGKTIIMPESTPINDLLPASIIQHVMHTCQTVVIDDASHVKEFHNDPYILRTQPKSIMCLPLLKQGVLNSILYLENNLTIEAFTQDRIDLMNLLSGQIVIAIDNARLYTHTMELNKSYQRFIPYQFLNLLEKKDILSVKLGDQVQKEMTVMFCDIRNFTTLSEKMSPQENMNFINQFLSYMEPLITEHNGFIDKYIGDAIMAIFPKCADDALRAANKMLKELNRFNKERKYQNLSPIHVGIGLNSGILMLGTVGDKHRMEGTVISDVVNSASRIQELTKKYKVNLLLTEETYSRLANPSAYSLRQIDAAMLRGKSELTTIYEAFDTDPKASYLLKYQTLKEFRHGLALFQESKFEEALTVFENIFKTNSKDKLAEYYVNRCKKILRENLTQQSSL